MPPTIDQKLGVKIPTLDKSVENQNKALALSQARDQLKTDTVAEIANTEKTIYIVTPDKPPVIEKIAAKNTGAGQIGKLSQNTINE